MPKEILDINSLMDNVSVKNRIVDGIVNIVFDGKQVRWEAGQTRQMPRKLADWFQAKSLYQFNPGDVNEGIPSKSLYKLVILDAGQDESEITKAEVANVKELLDTENMPETWVVDPATGKRMRRVFIDPRSTGARDKYIARERQVTAKISKKIIEAGAAEIAEAAESAGTAAVSEAEWKADLPPLVDPTTGRAVNV